MSPRQLTLKHVDTENVGKIMTTYIDYMDIVEARPLNNGDMVIFHRLPTSNANSSTGVSVVASVLHGFAQLTEGSVSAHSVALSRILDQLMASRESLFGQGKEFLKYGANIEDGKITMWTVSRRHMWVFSSMDDSHDQHIPLVLPLRRITDLCFEEHGPLGGTLLVKYLALLPAIDGRQNTVWGELLECDLRLAYFGTSVDFHELGLMWRQDMQLCGIEMAFAEENIDNVLDRFAMELQQGSIQLPMPSAGSRTINAHDTEPFGDDCNVEDVDDHLALECTDVVVQEGDTEVSEDFYTCDKDENGDNDNNVEAAHAEKAQRPKPSLKITTFATAETPTISNHVPSHAQSVTNSISAPLPPQLLRADSMRHVFQSHARYVPRVPSRLQRSLTVESGSTIRRPSDSETMDERSSQCSPITPTSTALPLSMCPPPPLPLLPKPTLSRRISSQPRIAVVAGEQDDLPEVKTFTDGFSQTEGVVLVPNARARSVSTSDEVAPVVSNRRQNRRHSFGANAPVDCAQLFRLKAQNTVDRIAASTQLVRYYTATCDSCAGQHPGELEFHERDVLQVIHKDQSGWWFAVLMESRGDGTWAAVREGWAPSTFLR